MTEREFINAFHAMSEVDLGPGPLRFFINDQFGDSETRMGEVLSGMRPAVLHWDRAKGLPDSGGVKREVAKAVERKS